MVADNTGEMPENEAGTPARPATGDGGDGIGLVRPVFIENEMRTSYLDYSMSVIVSRALPDVRDGLKPVQRRILHAMNELGLGASARYRKSAAVVGEVLGKYHPHGDASVYDALVRLAQEFSMRHPLIDGQGNFGSVDGDPAAAMRYTEARMTAIAEELLVDIDRDTVDMNDNYDSSQKEPSVLPAKVPHLLLNGASGIAVGMATNIPPHNLRELCDGLILQIRNPQVTVTELMDVVRGPDFPTGGTLFGAEGIRNAYSTGRGRMVLRAVTHVEEIRAGRMAIIATELPYQVNKAQLQERIAELVNDKRIDGVADIRDESDRNGMRLVIELKRDAQADAVLNNLFRLTPMQSSVSVNMLALVDGQPRVLGLTQIFDQYLLHRRTVVRRRTQYDLNRARAQMHIYEGLNIALDSLDAVITTIRNAASSAEAMPRLMERFGLSETQARAILELRLSRLAALERQNIIDELARLRARVAELEDILASTVRIDAIIVEELEDIKKRFGSDRRTSLVAADVDNFLPEDMIRQESVVINLTERGYIKRVPSDTYSAQGRGGKGITGMVTRDEDAVSTMLVAHSHDSVLFFTNRGRAFQLRVFELPEAGRTARGTPMANVIAVEGGERVTAMLTFPKDQDSGYLVMATTRGTIKRTPLHDFRNVRRNGIIAIGLAEDDELAWVQLAQGHENIMLVTSNGQAIRFKQSDVRSMGRNAAGVRGITLTQGAHVVTMALAAESSHLLVIGRRGIGKRTPLSEYPLRGRGGQGVRTLVTQKAGPVVSGIVTPDEAGEIIIMSAGGKIVRGQLSEVKTTGRVAQGVRLMRLNEGDAVVSLAYIPETAGDGSADGVDDGTAAGAVAEGSGQRAASLGNGGVESDADDVDGDGSLEDMVTAEHDPDLLPEDEADLAGGDESLSQPLDDALTDDENEEDSDSAS